MLKIAFFSQNNNEDLIYILVKTFRIIAESDLLNEMMFFMPLYIPQVSNERNVFVRIVEN